MTLIYLTTYLRTLKNQDKKDKARKKIYDEKLVVKGSFLEIIKASVTDAENEGPKKRATKKKKANKK